MSTGSIGRSAGGLATAPERREVAMSLLAPASAPGAPAFRAACDALAATCALDDSPTAACKGAVAGCEDNTWVGCQSGLAVERVPCPAETYCRSVTGRGKDDGAVCTLAPTPDPRCAVGRGFCDGNTLHRCRDGYLVFIAECITSCQWRQADNGDDSGWCDGGGSSSAGFDDGVPSSSGASAGS